MRFSGGKVKGKTLGFHPKPHKLLPWRAFPLSANCVCQLRAQSGEFCFAKLVTYREA